MMPTISRCYIAVARVLSTERDGAFGIGVKRGEM